MPVALLNVEPFWAEMRSPIASVIIRTNRDAEITYNYTELQETAAKGSAIL